MKLTGGIIDECVFLKTKIETRNTADSVCRTYSDL